MQKKILEYSSPVDALVTVIRRLSTYEKCHKITSKDFFDKYNKGQIKDSVDFVEWANDYQHYMALRIEIESHLRHVA
ncbi:conserved hypothetical protein [Candidatus Magnetomoraceae bacterium gMMP-15]